MDFSKLTNYQLYEIIQNIELNSEIQKNANNEINARKLSTDQIKEIISRHDSQFKPDEKGLSIESKVLISIFPFLTIIHSLFAGQHLAGGYKKKWKEYWFYICLGYFLWTITLLLFAKFYLFRTQTR